MTEQTSAHAAQSVAAQSLAAQSIAAQSLAAQSLAAQPFLRNLPADCIARLAETARHVSYPAGHRLFDEDSPARTFWIIDAGQVALDTLVPGVGRAVIGRLGRGDVVGLSWLQSPYQFRYGAVTTQPMQAYEFDAVAVRAACDQDPALGYALMDRFLAVALYRLQATRARLIEAKSSALPAGQR